MQLHECSLECTTGLKTSIQILFWKCSERKGYSKMSKIKKKNICKTVTFSLTLQCCSPEFPPSAKRDSKKNDSFECSDIVGSLPGKGLQ